MTIVNGSSLADTLDGTTAADSVFGFAGNDLIRGSAGADRIDGGGDIDTADYSSQAAAISINLATSLAAGGDAAGDTLIGIENLLAGAGADTLTGSNAANLLSGGGGADRLSGGSGADTLVGGNGADRLDGGSGLDLASYATDSVGVAVNLSTGRGAGGEAAGDTLVGIEAVLGGTGADTLTGAGAENTLSGGEGGDLLSGWAGADTLLGEAGADTLLGGTQGDWLEGGLGRDLLSYAADRAGVRINLTTGAAAGGEAEGDTIRGIEDVLGGRGADSLAGDAGANLLLGGSGADTLSGGGGADLLDGGSGVDAISYATDSVGVVVNLATGRGTGGDAAGDTIASIDAVLGGTGADTLTGAGAANTLSGGEGGDFLSGLAGADTLLGEAGADTLLGGAQGDWLEGGLGRDLLSYAADRAGVRINLATGGAAGGEAEGDTIRGIEDVLGGRGADSLAGDAGANLLLGGSGADTLSGGGGADTLDGGAGIDVVHLAGAASGYSLLTTGNTTTIIDIDAADGDTGTAVAIAAEFVVFGDGTRRALGGSNAAGGTSTGSITEDSADVIGGALPPGAGGAGGSGYRAPASLDGVYGRFTFDASTGAWTYRLDNSRATTQALPGGQSVQDVLSVTTADGAATLSITINVTGANDAAQITTLPVGTLREGSSLTLTGDVSVTDPDRGEAAFRTPASLVGTYGSFTFDVSTGVWTYALDNSGGATRALSSGDVRTDELRIVSLDGTAEQILVVSVRGSGTAARVTGTATGSVTEDGVARVVGDLDITTGDSGESRFATPASLAGTYGTFTFDEQTGAWAYELDNTRAVTQRLAVGAIATETLNIRTAFGSASQAITVTVTGVNDAASITGDASGSIAEGSGSSITGDFEIADVDTGEAVFRTPASLNGTYGTFAFNATTGEWSYALDNTRAATQGLTGGQVVTDSLVVTSADGSASQAITVTVTGANDAATITGDASGSITEGSGSSVTGDLDIADVDAGEAVFGTPASLNGTYGTFTFDATTGAWSYALDNTRAATQALTGGQVVTDSLVVTSADGSASQAITVTVTGANDAATITGDASGSITEGSGARLTGDLDVTDTDAGEAVFGTPASLNGTYGTFTFNATTGEWSYSLDNTRAATQGLTGGQTVTDSLVVTSADGSASRTIAVTVTGANDAATITGDASGAVTEGGGSSIAGDLDIADMDTGEAVFGTPASLNETYGTFAFNATTGEWSYALDNTRAATQALTGGQVVTDSLVVTSADGSASQAITVTVTGANDAATITGDASGSITEGSGSSITGDLDVADVDSGEAVFGTPASLNGTYGTFAFNATTGEWTYTLDNTRAATQGLTGGQTVTDSLVVTSVDGSASQAITVTVTGANDAATITGDASGAVTEGGGSSIAGDLDIADVDSGEAVFRTPALLNGTYGTFAFDATTGEWNYALDNTRAATQALTGGQVVTDSLVVTSADGSASQAITVTVTGANDAATITGDASGSITEGSDSSITGDLDVADVDSGEAVFGTPVSLNGTYGTFAFNATTGEWTYTLDNSNAAVRALTAGSTLTDTLTVSSLDNSASRAITVTINGANDRLVIDLTTLSAAQGFIIQGDAAYDQAGSSVSTAGDVNGDGFADVIVGAWAGDDGGYGAGEAYVVFGGAGGFGTADGAGRRVIDLTTLSAAQGFIIQGDTAYDLAGWSVSTPGDVNGDGFADLIVGARYGDDGGGQAGEAYVVFGGASGFGTADGAGRRVVDLTTLSAAQGFIIQGDAAGDQAGWSVSSAGDVNGDGFADLIVGAVTGGDGGVHAGEAYVVFGGTGGVGTAVGGRQVVDLTNLSAAQGFIIQGDAAGDGAGASVSTAGDVNGDGFADLVVGANQGDDGGTNAGEAYVLFGGAGGFGTAVGGRRVVDLTALTAAQGFIIQGDTARDGAGVRVSTAGDVNGDGFDDLIIGAPAGDDGGDDAGEAYVVFGGAGGFGTAVGGRQVVDLATLSAAQGFIIQGDTDQDLAGASVSSAGDVNGDGFDDLIVGAPRGDDGGTSAGEAYVLFGGAGGFGTAVGGRQVVDLTNLTAAQGFIIQGDTVGDLTGWSVSAAGDVNGDGFADLIVGARYGDDGSTAAGESYVVLGGAFGGGSTPVTTTGTTAAEILIGGRGDDSLSGGGGADVLRGGAGNDRLGVADGNFRSVDGGLGTDTLVLTGSGQTLDLTVNPMPGLNSIERFDLTGTGNNTLVLDRLAVLGVTEQRSAGVAIITVDGNAGDTLRFTETAWTNAGTTVSGGVTYTRYVSSDGSAEVRAAAAVTVAGLPVTRAVIDLTTLSAAQGFIIQGDAAGDFAGRSVSTAGDVNGDGFADVIVGAFDGDDGGTGAGEAYVVFGGAGGFGAADGAGRRVIDLTTLSAAQGFIIQGDGALDFAGYSVSTAGDVNGDGFADLIVGARYGDDGGTKAGEAYVVFGGAGGFGTADGAGRQVIDLTTLSATQGFIIQGDTAYDNAGRSVSSAGDVNGDGFADLLVGAWLGSDGGAGAGEAYVVFGGAGGFGTAVGGRQVIDLTNLTAARGFIIQGDTADDFAGASVSTAGDVNGDGFADLIVGAGRGDDGGREAGEAYVLFGGAGGFGTADGAGRRVIDLTTLTAAQGFIIQGDAAGDAAGASVSTAGDVNGDGFADLIVGAPAGDDGGTNAGEVYVLFGGAGGFGTAVGGRQVVDLTTLSAAQGFIIQGDTAGNRAGQSVSTAGDVNGDGFADLIVGAPSSGDGGRDAGEAYVLFGGAGGFGTAVGGRQVIDLTNLTAPQGFIIQGDTAYDQAGRSVSSAGDMNGDGFADLIVGARYGDDGGTDAGEAYVVLGGAFGGGSAPVTTTGTGAAEMLIGGRGDDSLSGGGGVDVLRGGAGNDRLGVADSSFRSVDGGLGTDTLVLTGGGQTLDLTVNPMPRLSSIERIDLTGTGANTLVLDRLAVLGLTEQRSAGVTIVTVDGNAGDMLRLTEWQWSETGSLVEGGVTYRRVVSSDGSAEIRVAQAVTLEIPAAPAPVIDLTTLNAAQGFIIRGDSAGDQAGRSVSEAGDVNGDGFADLIVGAPYGGDGGSNAGEAYVVFGGSSGFGTNDGAGRRVIDLTALTPAQGFIIQGDSVGDLGGWSVASAGDVNGDGFADVIVGASSGDDGGLAAGEAYVVFGAASGFGAADGAGRRVIDLTALTPAQGFIIQGDGAYDQAGRSVSSAGDVNGDGFADLIVGAWGGDDGGASAGEAHVVFGAAGGFGTADGAGRRVIDLTTLTAAQGFIIQGDTARDYAGFSVSSAGDVNGDGFADLIVGATGGDDGGSAAGEVYVVFGGAAGFGTADGAGRRVIDLTTLSAAQGFVIQGDTADDQAGTSVSDAGDVNGDGFDDLIFGARFGDDRRGEAYIVFGGASAFGSADASGRQVIDLTTLTAAQGFVIQGSVAFGEIGISVSVAGDVNGDGFGDLIVSAPFSDDGGSRAGEAYVLFGGASGFGTADGAGRRVIDLATLTTAQGFSIQGDAAHDQAGLSVSAAGDVNSDGFADLIVGAPGGDDGGINAGESYVVFGGAFGGGSAPVTTTGTGAAEMLIGGRGDDSLSGGGGVDVLRGGAGNDRLGVADSSFRNVDGGLGTDTLVLTGSGQTLDLTVNPMPRIESIERIDLTGTGANTLVLDRLAVLGLTEQRSAGVTILTVDGNAGDTLRFTETAWTNAGTTVSGGVTYTRYVSSDGSAEVRAAAVVTVEGLPPVRMVIDLTTLSAAQGFIIQGDTAADLAGASVSSAGDVNGDGFADVIVGAWRGDDGGETAGEAYVVFGAAGGFGAAVGGRQVVDLTTLSAAQGFIIQGDTTGDQAGISVSTAGDVNGDGFADLIVGANGGNDGGNGAGEAYVVFGGAGGFGTAVGGRQVVDLTTLSGSQGFIIQGDEAFDNSGMSVSTAGDVNGDGFDDLIVGARRGDDGGDAAGEAYVVFGGAGGFGAAVGGRQVVDLTTLGTGQGFIIQGDAAGDLAGYSVSMAGDVNGDGFADLIVGAIGGSGGGSAAGEAYVVFGGAGGFGTAVGGRQVVDLTTLSAAQGFIIQGDAAGDLAGYSVSMAGDVNGDGFADLIVGARQGDDGGNNAGEAYVVFGGAGGFGTADGAGRQVVDLTTLGASQGFVIQGDAADDRAGWSVSTAGDVNGDGFADLIVGANGGDDGGSDAGEAYVLFGGAGGFGTADGAGRQVVDLTTLSAAQGFIIQGDTTGDQAGISVSTAGDVNGDGFADLIVGANLGDDGGGGAGEAYVLFGGAFGSGSTPVTTTGTAAAEVLIGGRGDDTLTGGGGGDVVRGGAGDDRIVVADSAFRSIDGGTGTDIFVFGASGMTLDTTAIADTRIAGIEGFDMSAQGNNTLVIGAMDVLQFSDTPHADFRLADEVHTLVIEGDAGDTLDLRDFDPAGAAPNRFWSETASNRTLANGAGGTYDYWTLSDGTSTLAVLAVSNDIAVL